MSELEELRIDDLRIAMGRPENLFNWSTVDTAATFPPDRFIDGQPDDCAYVMCNMCNEVGVDALTCASCGAKYCSAACKNKDGPMHDRICHRFGPAPDRWYGDRKDDDDDDSSGSSTGVGGDDDHVDKNGPCRVLFWPQRESAPKFVWLEKRYIFGRAYEYMLEHLEVPSSEWRNWARANPRPPLVSIKAAMPWRRTGNGLIMVSLALTSIPEDGKGYLRPNFSIMALANPGELKIQYGPVIVIAFTRKLGVEGRIPHDVQMRDYRSFVDFYQFGRFNSCVPGRERHRYPLAAYGVRRLIPAVKYNSAFDARRLGFFARWAGKERLPISELVWTTSSSLNAPRRPWYFPRKVGLRWSIQQCVSNAESDPKQYWHIPEAETAMWTRLLYPAQDDGLISSELVRGSFLIVHEDGKEVHEAHVRAFGEWVLREMLGSHNSSLVPLVEACLQANLVKDYQFASHLTREGFERFFATLPPAEGERLESYALGPYVIEDLPIEDLSIEGLSIEGLSIGDR